MRRKALELLRHWLPKPGEDDLRGFEWHYWNRLSHQELETVRLAGFDGDGWTQSTPFLSPDGSRVIAFVPDAGGRASRLTFWDAQSGADSGASLCIGRGHQCSVWQLQRGRPTIRGRPVARVLADSGPRDRCLGRRHRRVGLPGQPNRRLGYHAGLVRRRREPRPADAWCDAGRSSRASVQGTTAFRREGDLSRAGRRIRRHPRLGLLQPGQPTAGDVPGFNCRWRPRAAVSTT